MSCLFQGVYISDDVLRRTYLEPENQEDKYEVVRHPDMDGEKYKHVHAKKKFLELIVYDEFFFIS